MEATGPILFTGIALVVVLIWGLFFNRYCIHGIIGDCKTCPHATNFEWITG